jgi:hypothetical protein
MLLLGGALTEVIGGLALTNNSLDTIGYVVGLSGALAIGAACKSLLAGLIAGAAAVPGVIAGGFGGSEDTFLGVLALDSIPVALVVIASVAASAVTAKAHGRREPGNAEGRS